MGIKIVTDSTADLPKNIIDMYGIVVVPLNIYFGEKTYKDGVDMDSNLFFNELLKDEHHPKTSQPSPSEFINAFSKIVSKGDDVISIHISSKMSGTVQSATIAKRELGDYEDRVHIIDSQTVSIQLASIVIETAKYISQERRTIDEVVEFIEKLKKESVLYFMVDGLKYLHKGGRIGSASAVIGGLLNVKPILTIENGVISVYSKARGEKKAILMIRNLILHAAEHGAIVANYTYLENDKALNLLRDKISTYFDNEDSIITMAGGVIGAHAGPGAFGVAILPKIH